jgi:serine-type D-Ala-D-Ala carboxypeptidase (penicillin-binding protein 5/6)
MTKCTGAFLALTVQIKYLYLDDRGEVMNKIAATIIVLVLIFSNRNVVNAEAKKPWVSADGAILMDAATGTILYSKNIDTAYPPASTTKIMTALLALENCKMDEIVVVGSKPPRTEGNNIALSQGEELSVKDMMYALVNESANDCANALAEHISGSVEAFAEKMNERARELGCRNTKFCNPSGLYHRYHRTSARDLALIMKELVKDDRFRTIASTHSYVIEPTNKTQRRRNIINHNRQIIKNSGYYYEACEGGKTGYTVQSKHSYVASAVKNGQRLVVALIHDSQKTFYQDSAKLFNYGFSKYELAKLCRKGDKIGDGSQASIVSAQDFYYVSKRNANQKPEIQLSYKNGEIMNEANIVLNKKVIGKIQLVINKKNVDKANEEAREVYSKNQALDESVQNNNKNKTVLSIRNKFLPIAIVLLLLGVFKFGRKV